MFALWSGERQTYCLTLSLLPASQAGRPGLCTPARLSTTPSCPSSLGPSLRTVSQCLELPVVREEARVWLGVKKHVVVETQSTMEICIFLVQEISVVVKKNMSTFMEVGRLNEIEDVQNYSSENHIYNVFVSKL